jgi:hypothetical protein
VRAADRPREQARWRPRLPIPVTGRLPPGRRRALLRRCLGGVALQQGGHGRGREAPSVEWEGPVRVLQELAPSPTAAVQ